MKVAARSERKETYRGRLPENMLRFHKTRGRGGISAPEWRHQALSEVLTQHDQHS